MVPVAIERLAKKDRNSITLANRKSCVRMGLARDRHTRFIWPKTLNVEKRRVEMACRIFDHAS